ncbi:transglutaminase-like domain-containing protein [Hansschlegelia plantiphila]|uniref:Transglutaminase n=1 Tax=Hansschlegelia plantiphila TaxID=374655 RepID=A0A9W6IWY5_9HYPH|nr:transglutaminase family protein [Hansschlegelia plantiphila]GLK66557.1 transglutaminase [Hansschlegelia plantiphila]
MKYKMGCELSYTIVEETMFIFNIEVAQLIRHRGLTDRVVCEPDAERLSYTVPDLQNRYLRVLAEPGDFQISYTAEVDLDVHRADPTTVHEMDVRDLPLDILPYLLPSRFVPSDRLAAFALREFGDFPRGHMRVSAICSWIYQNIDYVRGSSDAQTTATEILIQRAGVCRDFAHLGIAFCRALGIPARLVSCYAFGLSPADFHAVFEAYLDGRWWLFDGTRQAALDGLVRIGVGRDAAEIAFATPFGNMAPGPINIWIERDDGEPEPSPRTTDAISTEEPAPNAGAA